MLPPTVAAATRTTTHRCRHSRPHSGMTRENRLWGASRVHGELLKLGITVSERTVSRYLPDRRRPGVPSWRTTSVNLPSPRPWQHAGGGAWTTSSIPVCVHCPRLRCRLTQRAPPNTGQSSVGLRGSHARVRAGRMLGPTFTTEHQRTRAGTRQSRSRTRPAQTRVNGGSVTPTRQSAARPTDV